MRSVSSKREIARQLQTNATRTLIALSSSTSVLPYPPSGVAFLLSPPVSPPPRRPDRFLSCSSISAEMTVTPLAAMVDVCASERKISTASHTICSGPGSPSTDEGERVGRSSS